MRPTAAIALFLLALCLPSPVLAGTFVVPFGGGTPMLAAGWTPRPDAGAVCGYEGTGTVFLNVGSVPAHSGCMYLFNAPGAAQILAVNTTLAYAKASAATGLCAYSFAALPGDTLRRCSGGTYANAVATSGASWVELGLYNEGGTPIALATARANNVVFSSGWVTLADPTAPEVSGLGLSGIQTGLSAQIRWDVYDPESGSPAASYSIDGGARVGLRGQACSWLCGIADMGYASVDLSGLADGPHSLTVFAQSYADAGASAAPMQFTVDRNPPAQPVIRVEPDAAAAVTGWWGHGPIALALSSSTAADVASSTVRVYGPAGALVLSQVYGGAPSGAALPAAALAANGAYEVDVLQCDSAGHCAASPRAGFRWDGAAPAPSVDGFAAPLGARAARDGGHLAWPATTGAAGQSGFAGAFIGRGPTAASARAQALAATRWEAGLPGVSEAAIPGELIHGAAQVCLATRLVSGAGLAGATAGVRCAAIDELAPELALQGATAWSGGPQSVSLAVSDASGATVSEILLDGTPVGADGNVVTIAAEGAHVLRVVARDGAGNETVVERPLGVDAGRPSIGRVSADFAAREVRVDVADALSGVTRVELRLAGTLLETRLTADGRTAVARVPGATVLDGATVTVRAFDGADPANVGELALSLPVRPRPSLGGLSVSSSAVSGRVVAAASARVEIWAYPKGRVPHLVGTYATGADGAFAVHVKPKRTTRYAVAIAESQSLRGLDERVAGTVRVSARITALRLRVLGGRLLVRARFAGRGEATRLHLLVHDIRGGRWVEGCLEHGRPGVRLGRTGRVSGSCRIPPSARGRAWTYRLVLAAPSSAWPWRTPSSASSSVLLPL
ncbi:MAG TPA: hypothetical protein VFD90_20695 [Gaiellales bacterium]|jgi:hypothetical protein|nr:hypothetical protein [Gaiellales bacterium]